MAASGINANWTAVTMNSVPIDEVQSISISAGGQVMPFSSGLDRFPTNYAALMSVPSISITLSDVGTAMGTSLAVGTKGAFAATLKDAMGATGGDILFAAANAIVADQGMSDSHAQYASSTISIKPYSSDGSTPPISFTRA